MQAHIRTAMPTQFSEQEKFASFHSDGQLQDAFTVAGQVISWLYEPVSTIDRVIFRLDDLHNKYTQG
jgi:hypothetical protein